MNTYKTERNKIREKERIETMKIKANETRRETYKIERRENGDSSDIGFAHFFSSRILSYKIFFPVFHSLELCKSNC